MKHKKNHSKLLLRKHLKAKAELSKEEFKKHGPQQPEPEKQAEKERIEFVVKKDIFEENEESLSKKTWKRLMDFGSNKIIYENTLTGQQYETKPFGLREEDLETIAYDNSTPVVTNKWEEVKEEEDRVFHEKPHEAGEQEDLETHEKVLLKKDAIMEENWEKSNGDMRQAIRNLINTNSETDTDKFELLEKLAYKNLNLRKATIPIPEPINQPIPTQRNVLRKRKKIKKNN